jgi:hypothetical protein
MKRNIISIGLVIALFGCNSEKKDYAQTSSEVALGLDSAVADTLSNKIIKTADMQFRVKDVQKTKEQLSTTLKTAGGTIAEFSLNSSIRESEKVKYSTDSLKEITSYRTEGYLVAKVPSEKLDDFTNIVAKMAVFVDHQSMKMDDQNITYLANKFKAQNREEAVREIKKVGTKKSTNVESAMMIKDDLIDKKVENLFIDNRVRYSTITLNFYQDNTVKTLIVGNDNLYDYRPAFFTRLWLNIVNGWTIFKEFILLLANVWMLVLAGIALFLGIKYYKNRKLTSNKSF